MFVDSCIFDTPSLTLFYRVEYDLRTNTIISQARVCTTMCSGLQKSFERLDSDAHFSLFDSSSTTMSGPDSVVINGGEAGLRVYSLYSLQSSGCSTSVDCLRTLEQSGDKGRTTPPTLLCKALVILGTDSGEVVVWDTRTGQLEASFRNQSGTISLVRFTSYACFILSDQFCRNLHHIPWAAPPSHLGCGPHRR